MKKIILAIIVGVFLISFAIAWPYGFSYRRSINISNTAGEQTDFQVAVDLTEVDLNLTGLVGSWHFDDINPRTSCQDIKTWNPNSPNGIYEINPEGTPIDVYCDMTTNGGGWMLLDNFVSTLDGDYDPYGAAIGGSDIRDAGSVSGAGYDSYLTTYDTTSYTRTAGYLQMFYSGDPIGWINKTLPLYADEVYVKWGNWYSGTTDHLIIGGVTVQTPTANEGALTYQGSYNPGDSIHFEEGGIFWVGEVWVRKNQTNVIDSSGMDNNGVIYGAERGDGAEGYGMNFDGIDDYVKIEDNITVNGAMTLSFWFNSPTKVGNVYFADSRLSGTFWFIRNYTGSGLCQAESGNICYDGRALINDSDWSINTWHYLTVVDDTSASKLYLDGELMYTGTGEAVVVDDLWIGSRYTDVSFFDGSIDEFRIYDRSLSGTEINKSFCVGAYRLNQSQTFEYPSWCDSYIKSKYYSWQDLRFTNISGELKSGETFSHWIENDRTAWVEVPFLASNANTTVYANYGVSLMGSESDGNTTFVFFDDFEGGAIDSFRYGGGPHSQNIYLTTGSSSNAWGTNYLYSDETFARAEGLTFQGRVKTGTDYQNTMFGWQTSAGTSYTTMPHAFYIPDSADIRIYENGTNLGDTGHNFIDGEWYDIKIVLKTVGAKYYYKLSTSETWILVNETSTRTETDLTVGFDHYGGYSYMDTFFVHQDVSPEPTSQVYSEETRPSHVNPFKVLGSNHLKFSGSDFQFKIRSFSIG